MKVLTSIHRQVSALTVVLFLIVPLLALCTCTGIRSKPLTLRLVFSNEVRGYLDACG